MHGLLPRHWLEDGKEYGQVHTFESKWDAPTQIWLSFYMFVSLFPPSTCSLA